MKAFNQTIADLTRALESLRAEDAFQAGIQHFADQQETTLEAQAERKRLFTKWTSPLAAELHIQSGGADE